MMPRSSILHGRRRSSVVRGRSIPAIFCCILVCSLLFGFYPPPGVLQPVSAAPFTTAQAIPLRPDAYAIISASNRYDVMVGDGVNKDWRVARVKVDSVYFADVAAKLSSDASYVAFRITGNRAGGSSLYNVSVETGDYVQIDLAGNGSAGMGAYVWSPAGNTLAYVRSGAAGDPALVDQAYGTINVYSAGFEAVKLQTSSGNDRLLGFSGDGLGAYVERRESNPWLAHWSTCYTCLCRGVRAPRLLKSQANLKYSDFTLWPSNSVPKVAFVVEGDFALAAGNSPVKRIMPGMQTPAWRVEGERARQPGRAERAWAGDVRRAGD